MAQWPGTRLRKVEDRVMTSPKPLSLHVPEPPARPGGKPDFSRMEIPRAGAVRRPPVDVAAHAIHDLAYSIFR
ncbi:hypothetical protein WDZ92_37750, partial [Nostoc sp. NIES-2111]